MLCLQSFAKRSNLKCCILFPIVSSLEVRQLAEGQDVFPYVPYVPGGGGGGGDGSSGHSDSDMDGDGGVAIRGKSFIQFKYFDLKIASFTFFHCDI